MSDEIRIYKRLYHFVSTFTDDEQGFSVLKRWNKYKSRWVYEVFNNEFLTWLKTGERDE